MSFYPAVPLIISMARSFVFADGFLIYQISICSPFTHAAQFVHDAKPAVSVACLVLESPISLAWDHNQHLMFEGAFGSKFGTTICFLKIRDQMISCCMNSCCLWWHRNSPDEVLTLLKQHLTFIHLPCMLRCFSNPHSIKVSLMCLWSNSSTASRN